MRVLVTGGAGFIGSHVVEALGAAGYTVSVLDCLLPDAYPAEIKRINLDRISGLPYVDRIYPADLRSSDLADLVADSDFVVNEAAMPGLVKSWECFDTYLDCNVVGLQRLLDACRKAKVRRLVHASTSSVYGAVAIGDETQPTRACSPYGVSKLAAEHLIAAYRANFDLPAVVLRYFSVYGPRQRPDMAYHIFTERLLRGEPICITGDGSARRSNTFVTDIADATVRALTAGPDGAVYNIAGSESVSVLDAVNVLAESLGVTPVITFAPPRKGDQTDTRGDSSLANRVLGWTPQVKIAEGLREQARWHQTQHQITTAT